MEEMSRLVCKMNFNELRAAVFSIINKKDPYRAPKQHHLLNWCNTFSDLFSKNGAERLPFFLEVLSDEECWERTDTVHCINLNRRTVAKKMIQLHNWRGRINPLYDYERYRVACCCCIEEDIFALFLRVKQNIESIFPPVSSLRILKKVLLRDSEPLVKFWSYIACGLSKEIPVNGKNIYEYGLSLVLFMNIAYVEAVEYFWNKIKSLPETELTFQQKNEIILKIADRAIMTHSFKGGVEILVFCVNEMSSNLYLEFLKKDYIRNNLYSTIFLLCVSFDFDVYKKLLDCLKPINVSVEEYYETLQFLGNTKFSKFYTFEVLELFMHVWMKEGFDKHRSFVVRREMGKDGFLLAPLAKKNFMVALWAIMDVASSHQFKEFMESENASYISSVLQERGDNYSLKKFASYQNIRDFEISNEI